MSFDVCFKRPRKQARTPRNSQVRSHSHSHVTGSGQYRYRTHRGKRVSEMKGVSIRTSTSFSWSMNMGIKFGSYSFLGSVEACYHGLIGSDLVRLVPSRTRARNDANSQLLHSAEADDLPVAI